MLSNIAVEYMRDLGSIWQDWRKCSKSFRNRVDSAFPKFKSQYGPLEVLKIAGKVYVYILYFETVTS